MDAVQEIMESDSERLRELRQLLNRLPDLARGLSRIQYGKVSQIHRIRFVKDVLTSRIVHFV